MATIQIIFIMQDVEPISNVWERETEGRSSSTEGLRLA